MARDDEGVVTFWSRECERVTGYLRAEIEGNPLWREALAVSDDEFPCPLPDGEPVVVRLLSRTKEPKYITWRRAEIGDVRQWCIGVDVTDAHIRETQAQATIEHLSDGLMTLDHDLVITSVNPAGASIIGLEPGQSLGAKLLDLFPDAKNTKFATVFVEALANQQSYSFEEYYGGHGPAGWYSVRVHPLGATGIAVLFTNITARKEEEARLRESEERYRSLIRNTEIGFARVKPNGDYIYLSPSSSHLSGAVQEAVRREGPAAMLRFIEQEDQPLFRAMLEARSALSKEPMEIEIRLRHDGITRTLLERQVPSLDENGEVECYDLLLVDVTAQREMADRVRQAQRLGAVGSVAGRIAHEYNNLLTAIIGNVGLALDELDNDSPVVKRLKSVQGAANRAASLTRQLLAFTRKHQPKRVSMGIDGPLTAGIAEASRALPSIVEIRRAGDSVEHISMDPDQISLLLSNLIANGVEAISGAGAVTISVDTTRVTESLSPDGSPGDYVRVRVQDTGVGMTPDVLQRALEPFFTTKREVEGAGLGLTVAGGIAKQHGGWLEMESEQGAGSSVTLYLPVVVKTEPRRTVRAPGTGQAILIVDDEPALRSLAADFLRRAGYVPVTVAGGEEALAALAIPNDIAVAVLDLTMPGMSGRETLDRLRRSHPNLAVIVASGYSPDDEQELRALGIRAFLSKPHTGAELVDAVSTVLSARV